jgi:hypothetical protein
VAVSEEAVVTDALEATGQDVEDESAEEICGLKMEDSSFAAVRVIPPPQSDDAVVHAEQAIVGQGDAVGVAGEVVQDLPGPAKGLLGIDDPFAVPEFVGDVVMIGEDGAEGVEDLAAEDTG